MFSYIRHIRWYTMNIVVAWIYDIELDFFIFLKIKFLFYFKNKIMYYKVWGMEVFISRIIFYNYKIWVFKVFCFNTKYNTEQIFILYFCIIFRKAWFKIYNYRKKIIMHQLQFIKILINCKYYYVIGFLWLNFLSFEINLMIIPINLTNIDD